MPIDIVQCFEKLLEPITHVFYPDLIFLELTPKRDLSSEVPIDIGHHSLKHAFCFYDWLNPHLVLVKVLIEDPPPLFEQLEDQLDLGHVEIAKSWHFYLVNQRAGQVLASKLIVQELQVIDQ